MEKIKIGIISPSEIAFRRFLPSLAKIDNLEFAGVAIASAGEWEGNLTQEIQTNELNKAQNFIDNYGGKIYTSYHSLIEDSSIDAIYLPLPPALHYKWGKLVLLNKKHLFMEKPFTTSLEKSNELIALAKKNNLAIHENYMFVYHSQIEKIKNMINAGKIGKVHSYHARFGFPLRPLNDFRFNKALGGGALLDAGGYIIKLATLLLGDTIQLKAYESKDYPELGVDMYGSYMFTNDRHEVFLGEFGMDCEYQCSLNVWGSQGILSTDRILTAPDGFNPKVVILHNHEENEITLDADESFRKSLENFLLAVDDDKKRNEIVEKIQKQTSLLEEVMGK